MGLGGLVSVCQASELQSPTDSMRRFQAYLKQQWADDSVEQAPKRRRADVKEPAVPQQGDPAATDCKICYGRAINAVFAGCGHLVCCLTCAYRVDKCPICRVQVGPNDIIRTFTA